MRGSRTFSQGCGGGRGWVGSVGNIVCLGVGRSIAYFRKLYCVNLVSLNFPGMGGPRPSPLLPDPWMYIVQSGATRKTYLDGLKEYFLWFEIFAI